MLVEVLIAVRPEPVGEGIPAGPGEVTAVEELLVGCSVDRREKRLVGLALAAPNVAQRALAVAGQKRGVRRVRVLLGDRLTGPEGAQEIDDAAFPRLEMGEDVLARPAIVDGFEHRRLVERSQGSIEPKPAGGDGGSEGDAIHDGMIAGVLVRACQVSVGSKANRIASVIVSPAGTRSRAPGSPRSNRRIPAGAWVSGSTATASTPAGLAAMT